MAQPYPVQDARIIEDAGDELMDHEDLNVQDGNGGDCEITFNVDGGELVAQMSVSENVTYRAGVLEGVRPRRKVPRHRAGRLWRCRGGSDHAKGIAAAIALSKA